MQIFKFTLGVTQILAFLDTNMLVWVTQNCGVLGPSQRQYPTGMFFLTQWNIGFIVGVWTLFSETGWTVPAWGVRTVSCLRHSQNPLLGVLDGGVSGLGLSPRHGGC